MITAKKIVFGDFTIDYENAQSVEMKEFANFNNTMLRLTDDGRVRLIFAGSFSSSNFSKKKFSEFLSKKENRDFISLRKAVENKDIAEINRLVKSGININLANTNKITALMYACSIQGSYDMVKRLIELGANVNQESLGKESPLIIAADCGIEEVVDILIQNNANVFQIRQGNLSAFELANRGNHTNIASKIASHINKPSTNGQPIIIQAALEKNNAKIDSILKCGGSIDAKDLDGNTALIHAVKQKDISTIKLLISKKANTHIKNHKGQTAGDIANDMGDEELLAIFKKPENSGSFWGWLFGCDTDKKETPDTAKPKNTTPKHP